MSLPTELFIARVGEKYDLMYSIKMVNPNEVISYTDLAFWFEVGRDYYSLLEFQQRAKWYALSMDNIKAMREKGYVIIECNEIYMSKQYPDTVSHEIQ